MIEGFSFCTNFVAIFFLNDVKVPNIRKFRLNNLIRMLSWMSQYRELWRLAQVYFHLSVL